MRMDTGRVTCPPDRVTARDNTLQRGRMEMGVGGDGRPQGPSPPRLSPLYLSPDRVPLRYTEQRGSEYRRGEGGGDAEGRALVVARPVPTNGSAWDLLS